MIKKLLPLILFKYAPVILRSAVLAIVFVSLSCSRIATDNAEKGDAAPAAADPNLGAVVLNRPAQPAAAANATLALTDMPFEQLVNVTSGLLDDFWRQSFKDMRWQEKYSTPKGLIPYTQPMQSGCGVVTMNNAFYCSADQKIYFDDNLVRGLYQDPGDYAAVTVLAHEWGHSVQHDLGIMGGDKDYFPIQTELQADCFAGAFAKHIS